MEVVERGTPETLALDLLIEVAKSRQVLLLLRLSEGWHFLEHPAGSMCCPPTYISPWICI